MNLVIESGTTLKAILDAIGPQLKARENDLRAVIAKGGRIRIVTNNFPGAESYQARCKSKECLLGEQLPLISNRASNRISDFVTCRLVPGIALREYSAVVGSEARPWV